MRDEIMSGNVQPPALSQIAELMGNNTVNWYQRFWSSLWANLLTDLDSSTSLFYWFDQCDNTDHFNEILESLIAHKWVTTSIRPNEAWASVQLNKDKLYEWVTEAELFQLSVNYKTNKYLLGFTESTAVTLVRQNGRTIRSGLVRRGFADAGNTQFGYDTAMMQKYQYSIQRQLTKGMEKVRETRPSMKTEANDYDVISLQVLQHHMADSNQLYTTGTNMSDSRGRAISNGLKRTFNPIGNKDARALLVITYP